MDTSDCVYLYTIKNGARRTNLIIRGIGFWLS